MSTLAQLELTEEELTNNRISTLLWLKAIDMHTEGKYKDYNFSEKYTAFATSGDSIKDLDFIEGIEFWIDKGLFYGTVDKLYASDLSEEIFNTPEIIAIITKSDCNCNIYNWNTFCTAIQPYIAIFMPQIVAAIIKFIEMMT